MKSFSIKSNIRNLLIELVNKLSHNILSALINFQLIDKYIRHYIKNHDDYIIVFNNYFYKNIRFNLNKKYRIEKLLMEYGFYDESLLLCIDKIIKPEFICIDVGANIGAISLFISQKLQSGIIECIEPEPTNIGRLKENVSLNPLLNNRIRVTQVGFGSKKTEMFIDMVPDNLGNAIMSSSIGHKVTLTTLDDWFYEQELNRIDLIKIDVEGMEWDVIKGGLRTIEHFKPIIIFESIKGAFDDQKLEQIFNTLGKLDYSFYTFDAGTQTFSSTNYNNPTQNTIAWHKFKED